MDSNKRSSSVFLNSLNIRTEVEEHPDVLVAGAGVMGLFYALHLQKILPKAKILVVDKHQRPTYKIGESTLSNFTKFCNDHVLPPEFMLRLFAVKDGLQFYGVDHPEQTFSDAAHVDIGGLDVSYQVERDVLELLLCRVAQRKGIQVLFDCKINAEESTINTASKHVPVALSRERFDLKPKFVCDATGEASVFASKFQKPVRDQTAWNTNAYWGYFRQKSSANTDIKLPHWNRVATRHLCFPEGWVWFIRLLSWEGTSIENLTRMIDYLLDQHEAGVPEDKLPCVTQLAERFGCAYKVVMSIGITVRTDADEAIGRDVVERDAEARFNYWRTKYRILNETMSHFDLEEYAGRTFFVRKRLAYRVPQVTGRGWLAIGNASGFTNPIYSPGMNVGVLQSFKASEVTAKSFFHGDLSENNLIEIYRDWHEKTLDFLGKDVRFWYNCFRHRDLFESMLGTKMAFITGNEFLNFRAGMMWDDLAWVWGAFDEKFCAYVNQTLDLLDDTFPDGKLPAVDEQIRSSIRNAGQALVQQHLLPNLTTAPWGRYFSNYDDRLNRTPGKTRRTRGNYEFVQCTSCGHWRADYMSTCPMCGEKTETPFSYPIHTA